MDTNHSSFSTPGIEIGSMFSKQMWWKVLRWDGMNERHSKGI